MKKVLIAYFSHEGEAYVGGKIVKLKIKIQGLRHR